METCSNEILNAISSAQKGQKAKKKKKRDFRSNINFLIPHVLPELKYPFETSQIQTRAGWDARER